MGSAPREELLKSVQMEAYALLLRALYSPHHQEDPLVRRLEYCKEGHLIVFNAFLQKVQSFLSQAQALLDVSPSDASQIFENERTNIELIRSGRRPPSTGHALPGYGTPGSLPPGPIGAPGSSKARSRALAAAKTPISGADGPRSLPRVRSTRSSGSIDPSGYVGRRIWRHYPEENPQNPWVEGFIVDYDKQTGTYSILYDPNSPDGVPESKEDGFDFLTASQDDYVLGDYFDVSTWAGSSRLPTRPAPVTITPKTAPSKRRRTSVKIPLAVPFPQDWLQNILPEATGDDLQSMLIMLEKREIELTHAIEEEEKAIAQGEGHAEWRMLEEKFIDLCRREDEIMKQLAALRKQEQ